MPVNYAQVQQKIREKSGQARTRQVEARQKLERACNLLREQAGNLDELRARVNALAARERNLRCAVPLDENLDTAHLAPVPEEYPHLLAADGSQINPDRHNPVEFALVNLGIIHMTPGKAQVPDETVHTQLFLYDDVESSHGPLTEEQVALQRDLEERQVLADMAARLPGLLPVLTLTDGPLELYREPKENRAFEEAFKQYLDVLERMAGTNVIAAGYVDKPASDLVVRLLELALYKPEQLEQASQERQLFGVPDRTLFAGLLPPGARSALFAIQSSGAERFRTRSQGLSPCFFYLNVGRENYPWPVRVEIPLWVARHPPMVDLLHATLLQQCRQMGAGSFPYALHRAHEIAVVSYQDAQQVQTLIELELRRLGLDVGDKSYKQSAKDLEGRTVYKA